MSACEETHVTDRETESHSGTGIYVPDGTQLASGPLTPPLSNQTLKKWKNRKKISNAIYITVLQLNGVPQPKVCLVETSPQRFLR